MLITLRSDRIEVWDAVPELWEIAEALYPLPNHDVSLNVSQDTQETLLTWDADGVTPENVRDAINLTISKRIRRELDEEGASEVYCRVFRLGRFRIFLHKDSGPPLWILPRLRFKRPKDGGLELGAGWRYTAYAIYFEMSSSSGKPLPIEGT